MPDHFPSDETSLNKMAVNEVPRENGGKRGELNESNEIWYDQKVIFIFHLYKFNKDNFHTFVVMSIYIITYERLRNVLSILG